MKTKCHHTTILGKLGSAIGKGIIAGIAGTAAITLSQMIEMKLTGRQPSTAPADAASKVLEVNPESEESKQQFSQQVHWSYGIGWGITRGLLDFVGIKNLWGTAAHFSAITATAFILETQLDIAPPVNEWEAETLFTTVFHHAVYAIAAGLMFEAI